MSTNQYKLNKTTPAAARAKLGDAMADLIARINAMSTQLALLTTKYNAALAKLDLDATVTDVNYASTSGATAYVDVAVTDLESR